MKYTPRQLILYIKEQGYSDQAIADACKCDRVTVTNVRLGHPRYTGNHIYRRLIRIVQNLQQQLKQEEIQPLPQSQVTQQQPRVYHPPQVQRSTTLEQSYCPSCPFRSLVPPGMAGQQLTQWLKEHPCSAKRTGQCSV